ncbi:MAG: hypothetical protein IJ439_04930 [Tyzzerella sp.]|nr:hypothetical protein [Tyzzerella sp.]
MEKAIKRGKEKLIGAAILIMLLMICTSCALLVPKEAPPYMEILVEDIVFEDKFYYEQLSDEDQIVYKEIYQGLMDQKEKIYVHSIDAESVNKIFENVIYDFAEIFWIDGTAVSTTFDDTYYSEYHTVIEVNYTYSDEERAQKETEIESAVTEVINGIPSELNEYEKIRYVYEYLINNVSYVEEAPDNQNLYSSLVRKETVCAGYAKATQYLLNRLGVYCTYVVGTTTRDGETENHAWNIVRCAGNYYYVDVTWADPIVDEENPLAVNELAYDYLCCSQSDLAETHVLQEGYDYPACHSGDLNYYRLNDMFYETADEQQLLNKLRASIDAKAESVVFKFADAASYEYGRQLMLDKLMNSAAEYLCNRYRLNQVEYYYAEDAVLHKFAVYWSYE